MKTYKSIIKENEKQAIDNMTDIVPISFGEIEVYPKDLKNKLTFYQAEELINVIGNGWRLPTLEELRSLYDNFYLQDFGGFVDYIYWASDSDNKFYAWFKDFYNGMEADNWKGYKYKVRLVRNI